MYAIVHISDLHLESSTSLKPADKVVASIRGLTLEPEEVLIAVTGDVAYSGKPAQYDLASSYFESLLSGLQEAFGCSCHFVVCPGNHDCDFPEDSAVRDLVVEQICSQASLPDSQAMIDQCLVVQRGFFDWLERFNAQVTPGWSQLAWPRSIHCVGNINIDVRVLNTAWASTIKEQQRQLYFPPDVIPEPPSAEVRLTLLHHPYNWLRPDNSRELRRVLEGTSDLILTGHEHDPDFFGKVQRSGQPVNYIEGGIFCDPSDQGTSFNVIELDPTEARFRVFVLNWTGKTFEADDQESPWWNYICESSTVTRAQLLSEETLAFLKDPGLQLTHRAKEVELEDIFVAPDLLTYQHSLKAGTLPTATVPSSVSVNRLLEDKYVYLLGETQCGKTSLGKILYLQALRRGITPVYLVGSRITRPDEMALLRAVEQAVGNQYKNLSAQAFWQLDPSDRVVILDDFGQARMNARAKASVADWLRQKFGRAFIFGGDLTQIEEVVLDSAGTGVLAGYKRYEIRPFGHLLRDLLIEKWLTLGKGHSFEEEELHHRIRGAAGTIDTILGRNLLPKTPLSVLIVLQQLEAQVPLSTSSGSYGYFYETILTLALQRFSSSPEEIDAKYTYLAELAWYMFKRGSAELDQEEFQTFSRRHCDGFRLTKMPAELEDELVKSRVLIPCNGRVRFSCKFFQYYFIARYLRDNLEEDEVQGVIDNAARDIHREDHANVLIFLTYLTKSRNIIERVLDTSRALFSEIEPCNLSEHVEFLNRIQESVPRIVLPEGDPAQRRRDALRRLDDEDSRRQAEDEDRAPEDVEADIETLLSMNRAIKALQVLGQILRNFSGSLRQELKIDIARECFDNGLRMLNAFYSMLEKYLSTVLTDLAKLFGRDLMNVPARERAKVAREFLFFVTEMMSFGTLRRISAAVGSEQLVRTYEDVQEEYDTRAARFVQLCLHLDHCRSFPEGRVVDLYKEVQGDVFGLTLLRMLVADHFYLFPRSYRTRQRICNKLGISYQRTIERRTVKMRPGGGNEVSR